MNHQQVCTLIDYHYWARDRLLEALEPLSPEQFTRTIENSFPSVRQTLAHLCGAEWVWVSRWDGEMPTAIPDGHELTDVAAVRVAWGGQERRLRGVLERLGQERVGHPIEYRGFDGRLYTQQLWEMVQHLVTHGAYHRGQLTMMLRQLGAPPARPMDLIVFQRERAAPPT